MSEIPKSGDFSQLLGFGENPNGMIAQTPNGTEHGGMGSEGVQYNWGRGADGERWNTNPLAPEEPTTFPASPVSRVLVASHTRKRPK